MQAHCQAGSQTEARGQATEWSMTEPQLEKARGIEVSTVGNSGNCS